MPIKLRALSSFLLLPVLLVGVGCGDHHPFAPRPGRVAIAVAPAGLAAPWTLSRPDGRTRSGVGDAGLEDMPTGDYTITWGAVDGWIAPEEATSTLFDGGTITFRGTYLRAPLATPDAVAAAFRTAYDDRDLDLYAHLLSPDFLFVGQNGSRDDHDAELQIAAKLFGGHEGNGNTLIGGIVVHGLEPQSDWLDTTADDPNFGGTASRFRQYAVDITFVDVGQDLERHVHGPVLLYVEEVGEVVADHKLIGVVDFTVDGDSDTELSLSALKAMFR